MRELPITGTARTVSFFDDDTIQTVRERIALQVNSHPDRLFVMVKCEVPREYYSSNPKHWSELFFRLSYDGKTVSADALTTYVSEIHPTQMTPRAVTLEEWDEHADEVKPLLDPEVDGYEWRILGVNVANSVILPLPPKEVALPAALIPTPAGQSLFETFHATGSAFRVFELEDTMSDRVKSVYFPFFTPDTPTNIQSKTASLDKAQATLQRLLDLQEVVTHETTTLVRAKWFVPLISTRFVAPRARFEQIFYGMTVSKETPYIGYFTSKSESMRHKFYVENPKDKKPLVDTTMWRGWLSTSMPQRQRPTLLLYRGTSRGSYDRISLTPTDLTLSCVRTKESTESMDDLKKRLASWLSTLDALTPFLVGSDVTDDRWELGDLSVIATYPKEVREFDMHRFPCLQTIFGFQKDTFRLLRTEHGNDDVSPKEIQAIQILNEEGAEPSPDLLAREMDMSAQEAADLFTKVTTRAEDINMEKSLQTYPAVKFTNKEVLIKFVTSLERTLRYVDILRHVLTSDSDEVNAVCPRRMDIVAAKVAPAMIVPEDDDGVDPFAEFGFERDEEAPAQETAQEPPPGAKTKNLAVGKTETRTYNYFNNRLQTFDPATFDKDLYPENCEKLKQVVALTPEDQQRIPPAYNYADAPEAEKLNSKDPDGLLICPPYWCMRDELPLREEQLVKDDDGKLQCPVCNGKVRTSDTLDTREYSVISRKKGHQFPRLMKVLSGINQRRIPCCYKTPSSTSAVLERKEDETYILKSDTPVLPSMRLARLPPETSKRLHLTTHYETSIQSDRLVVTGTDIFRVGLGRPSKTLTVLLDDNTVIRRPNEAVDNVMRCSFFRTWTDMGKGDTQLERTIAGIDQAFQSGEMNSLDELEYTTTFLRCEVIRLDPNTLDVLCGFWSNKRPDTGEFSRAIAVMGNDILARVQRVRGAGHKFKTQYMANLHQSPFKEATLPLLRQAHTRACSMNLPSWDNAIQEIQSHGKTNYEVILDPFKRPQALFVPKEICLPFQPTGIDVTAGTVLRSGYADIDTADLPTQATVRAFMKDAKHPGFTIDRALHDSDGRVVELLLVSGFRVPVQPEADGDANAPVEEVLDTVRKAKEETLVDAPPNPADIRLAQEISYSSEVYEFLMFSLAHDLTMEEYTTLRGQVAERSASLVKHLTTWFKSEGYVDKTKSPQDLVNKVRVPCGQYTDEDACRKSTLCGWHKKTCKIKVKPVVEIDQIIKRMAVTLRGNDKQRALVLDNRVSPFFSTILYLEMPHELITTGAV